MKRKFSIFFLLSSFFFCFFSAHASLGDELNDLLDRFFTPQAQEEPVSELDIPDIELPESPTEEDVKEFQKKIQKEEETIAEFETQLEMARNKLWDVQQEKITLENQLKQIDQELGLVSGKLEQLEQQEQQWQDQLTSITKKSSDLKALLRVKEQELQDFLQKNYLRQENFGGGETGSILTWLFSSKRVSEILEERRLNKKFVQEKKGKLIELEYLKKELEENERYVVLLHNHVAQLRENISAEKNTLSEFAEAKARMIARLEFSEGKMQKEIENYDRQRLESEIFLQNLHTALEKIAEQAGIKDSNPLFSGFESKEMKLDFPLHIPMKVTAGFQDPEYEKYFKRTHLGTDFFAPQGTEIFAPAKGTVKKVSTGIEEYGYAYLILDHGHDLYTVYGHVSDILVNEGQEVAKGEVIALTGGTPGMKGSGFFTTGPHLHFEVFQDGKHVDPMAMIKETKSQKD